MIERSLLANFQFFIWLSPLQPHAGVEDLIGRTPMVRLPYLSELLGVTVLAKMEMLSIGGSSKVRFLFPPLFLSPLCVHMLMDHF